LVTPTHQLPQILCALALAIGAGLRLPIVYNCGGYESLEALRVLDGVVDIYLPDFKYGDAETGRRFSGVDDYPGVARAAVREMYRQVGDLEIDPTGTAWRGLLVRHLVLPNSLAHTATVATFLAELSPRTYLNVIGQYRPRYRAYDYPELSRRPTAEEISRAVKVVRGAGLRYPDEVTEAA
jgi:putative pyruvate formate lyase activating enzyme